MSSSRLPLTPLDALEVHVLVDNEVDPISSYSQISPGIEVSGRFADLGMTSPFPAKDRGAAKKEMRMERLCCGAHGLSLMITAIKGNERRTILFDTGPEEDVWEKNATRTRVDLSAIELIHLSHWHRDHSGGMLRAIDLINRAKRNRPLSPRAGPLIADLHPSRPAYRGFMLTEPISLEADPSFEEISSAGAKITKSAEPHTVLNDTFLISGEIPRVTPYETGVQRAIRFDEVKGEWESDELILDERLVVCNVKDKGLVIFTGCSHAGVINTTRHALSLAAAGTDTPIYAVIGGFHLVGQEEAKVPVTVEDFKELKPKVLVPGHCSGWRVKHEIEKEMPGTLAPCTVGTKFKF